MLYFFIATTMVANTAIAGRMINYIVFYMLLYYVDALYRLRLPQNLLAFVFFSPFLYCLMPIIMQEICLM